MIFLECGIELPVKLVLNRPVARNRRGKALRREFFADDLLADVDVFLAFSGRVADHHSDGLQIRPAIATTTKLTKGCVIFRRRGSARLAKWLCRLAANGVAIGMMMSLMTPLRRGPQQRCHCSIAPLRQTAHHGTVAPADD